MVNIDRNRAVTGEIYHVFTKSIAGFRIFTLKEEFSRIKNLLRYYQHKHLPMKFSKFKELQRSLDVKLEEINKHEKIVDIIAYCVMPTHIHLVLKQLTDNAISIFMNNILNSYTRYFNVKHKRKGPLWEGRFKKVRVESDEQLMHLTRYLHLNPVTSKLVDLPEAWRMSSYSEYIDQGENAVSNFEKILDIIPEQYKEFVADRIDYQRELKIISHILFE
ncbi:MAG: transposase [Candidatus Omnitrophota bacterium]